MTESMKRRLSEYIGTDVLISIYDDDDEPESFSLGFVLAVDDNFVLLNAVNKYGENIGFLLVNLESIFLFNNDLMYSGKVMKLFKLKNQHKETLEILNNDILLSVLETVKMQKCLIEINNDDNYIGYIKEYNNELLTLNSIDNYGNHLGLAYIDINHINVAQCRDMYLKDLELLYGAK